MTEKRREKFIAEADDFVWPWDERSKDTIGAVEEEEEEEKGVGQLQQKYNPNRDELGRFASGGGVGAATESRAKRAKRTHKPSTAEKQRRGEAEQARLAKLVRGRETDDNDAFDVLKGKHAVEVKTVMDNNNDKITVHPKSRRRKEAFAEKRRMQMHTIAIDIRGGKRVYYHKNGVGAFRLSSMDRVTVSELRERLS